MRASRVFACALAGTLGAVVNACHRQAPPQASPVPAVDSLRGVVQRVGNEPRSAVTVRAADGTTCELRFAAADPAPALEGLDVVVWGTRSGAAPAAASGAACMLDVARFAVRAVDGIAAVDGVLRADGESFALETGAGARLPLRDVPVALRGQLGARIFWAGPLDRAPAAYGVIVSAR